jgi:L-ascorbate metabolism protein UlaG (beta-lactamase superfamily)
MKITRFAQSCILIETKNKRILVDPGDLQFDISLLKNDWNDIDILLVTHKHSDHCHVDAIKEIMKNPKTKLYTSQEVASTYPEIKPEIVKENDVKDVDGIRINVVKAVHGFIPLLKGGWEISENIGFIIDDGEKRAYLTSDTICFDNEYECDVLFIPVCNHGLVMGPFEAALFAKETGAKLVIPFHYDNPKFPANKDLVKSEFEKHGLNFRFLELGESIEF